MWVTSESGRLFNLEHAYEVALEGNEQKGYVVEARFNTPPSPGLGTNCAISGRLAGFKSEEEARRVLERIASGIKRKDSHLDLTEPPA